MRDLSGFILQRRNQAFLFLVFFVAFFSRLLFREISFWEFDEILFANALHRFDVLNGSPHPPGYPIYVALGRVARLLTGDDLKALVSLSVLFGSLTVFPLYYFFERLTGPQMASWGVLLFVFNPVIWLNSENAFSDTTGLFWIILSLALLLYAERRHKYLYLGSFSLGIAVGVRPQNALLALILFPFMLWQRFRQREYKAIVYSLGIFSVACLLWFIPLCYYNGGLKRYFWIIHGYGQGFVGEDRGILNVGLSGAPYNLKQVFFTTWGSGYVAVVIYISFLAGLGVFIKKRKWTELFFLSACFLPQLVFVLLFLDPDFLKYSIPHISYFCALVPVGLFLLTSKLGRFQEVAFSLGLLALISYSIAYTYPAVKIKHYEKSPVVASLEYARKNLKPDQDLILCDEELQPFVTYMAQGLPVFSRPYLSEDFEQVLAAHKNWFSLTRYFPDLSSTWKRNFKQTSRRLYNLDTKSFFNVWLSKVDVLYAFAWESINSGDVLEPEGAPSRWMIGDYATCYLKNRNGLDKTLYILANLPLTKTSEGVSVRFKVNGKVIDDSYQESDPMSKACPVPAEILAGKEWSKLEIAVDSTFNPSKQEEDPGPDIEYGILVLDLTWLDAVWATRDHARVLNFTNQSLGCLIKGWSPIGLSEDGHSVAWNTEAEAAVLLPLREARDFQLLVHRLLSPIDADFLKMGIYLNDKRLTELQLQRPMEWREDAVLIPKAALINGLNQLTFKFEYPPDLAEVPHEPRPIEGAVSFDYLKLVPASQ